MKVTCAMCQTFVELDTAGDGPPLPFVCSACRAAVRTDLAAGGGLATARRVTSVPPPPAPQPKKGPGPTMQLDFDDSDPPMPLVRRDQTRPPPSDEPVSLREIQQLLAPGKDPPRWAAAPDSSFSASTARRAAQAAVARTEGRAMVARVVRAPAPTERGLGDDRPPTPSSFPRAEPTLLFPPDSSVEDLELMALIGAVPAAPSQPGPSDVRAVPSNDRARGVQRTPTPIAANDAPPTARVPVPAPNDDSKMMDLRQMVAAHPASRAAPAQAADSAVIKLSSDLFQRGDADADADADATRDTAPAADDDDATRDTAAATDVAAPRIVDPLPLADTVPLSEAPTLRADHDDDEPPVRKPRATDTARSPRRKPPERAMIARDPPSSLRKISERPRSWAWAMAVLVACAVAWLAAHPGRRNAEPEPVADIAPPATASLPAAITPADSAIAADTTATAAPPIPSASAATTTAVLPAATAAPRPTPTARTSIAAVAPTAAPLASSSPATTASATASATATATASASAAPIATASGAIPDAARTATASAGAFDRGAANAALASAAQKAQACRNPYDPGGDAQVAVTFAPSGHVSGTAVSGGSLAGTSTGNCIAAAFRSITVPAFDGAPVTMVRTVNFP